MKIFKTKFEDVKLFIPNVYHDDRGFFTESYNQTVQNLLNVNFLQDNHSKSNKFVIRGLHYQWDIPMGKLLRVVSGAGIDIIVDIRKNSPTYGQHDIFSLTDENFHILWVPPGFAQGFLATEENTHLCYKTTALHNGNSEGAIHPIESGLDIDWGIPNEHIILSEKDRTAQTFNNYDKEPKFY